MSDPQTHSLDRHSGQHGRAAALQAAVAAIYFDDGSDFKSALFEVVQALDPALAKMLEDNPQQAHKTATMAMVEAQKAVEAVEATRASHATDPPNSPIDLPGFSAHESAAIREADLALKSAGLATHTEVFSSRAKLLTRSRDLLAVAGGNWPAHLVASAQGLRDCTNVASAPGGESPEPALPVVRMSGVAMRKVADLIHDGYQVVGCALEKPGARSAVMFDAAVRWLTDAQRHDLMFKSGLPELDHSEASDGSNEPSGVPTRNEVPRA